MASSSIELLSSEQIMSLFFAWQEAKRPDGKIKIKDKLILFLRSNLSLNLTNIFTFSVAEGGLLTAIKSLFFNKPCFDLLLAALNPEYSQITSLSLEESRSYVHEEEGTSALFFLSEFIAALKQSSRLATLSLSFACFQGSECSSTNVLVEKTTPLLMEDSVLRHLSLQRGISASFYFSATSISSIFKVLKERNTPFHSLALHSCVMYSSETAAALISSFSQMPFPLLLELNLTGPWVSGGDIGELLDALINESHLLTSLHLNGDWLQMHEETINKIATTLPKTSLRSFALTRWNISGSQFQIFIENLRQQKGSLVALDIEIASEVSQAFQSLSKALRQEPFLAIEQLRLTFNPEIVQPQEGINAFIAALGTSNILKTLIIYNSVEKACFLSMTQLRLLTQFLRINESLEILDLGVKDCWSEEESLLLKQINSFLERNSQNRRVKSSDYNLFSLLLPCAFFDSKKAIKPPITANFNPLEASRTPNNFLR